MKYLFCILTICLCSFNVTGKNSENVSTNLREDNWIIHTSSKENYNGVTLANGRIGLVSGAEHI